MATTWEMSHVVCAVHSVRYNASGVCPECDYKQRQGVHYGETERVTIAKT